MIRYSPGIYQIVNKHGTGYYDYYLDNQKYQIIDQGTITVIVRDNLYAESDVNLVILKIGQIGSIQGNGSKWTD